MTAQRRTACLLALAFTGGLMDATSYVGTQVFSGNMTGNTVLVGIALGAGHYHDVAARLCALAAYFAGVLFGARAEGERSDDDGTPARAALRLEAAALVLFAALWFLPASTPRLYELVVCGSIALGFQTAATRRSFGKSSSTTYMSGTLARFAWSSAGLFDRRLRWKDVRGPASVWAGYLLGALLTGIAVRLHAFALHLAPLVALAIVIVVASLPAPTSMARAPAAER
jgi:uncharacterized membrane protein YoaK (UPF0700 family)